MMKGSHQYKSMYMQLTFRSPLKNSLVNWLAIELYERPMYWFLANIDSYHVWRQNKQYFVILRERIESPNWNIVKKSSQGDCNKLTNLEKINAAQAGALDPNWAVP